MSDRAVVGLAAALSIISAACGGTPTSATPPVQRLEIVGMPASVTKGISVSLRAVLVSGAAQGDCAGAQWAIDDGNVARISTQGVLTGLLTGFANVTVTCSGLTSIARVKVEGQVGRPWVYGRDVDLFPSSCGALQGASCVTVPTVTIDFLDGPRAGEQHPQSDLPGMRGLVLPITVRASARFYATREFVLAESTVTWFQNGHDAIWSIPMTFVGDSQTDTYVDYVRNHVSRPFAARAAGTLEVGMFWFNGDPSSGEFLFPELWCGGQLLQRSAQRDGYSGIAMTQAVTQPASCEVKTSGYGGSKYRLTITYPH